MYFLNIILFIIHIVIKNFIINLKLLLTWFYKFNNMTTSKAIKLNEQRKHIMNINQQIEMLESKIDAIKAEIENKQSEINNFEYEISESDFNDFLDDIEESVTICGMTFYPSDILKSCDPIAYRCAKSDYESNIDLDDVAEYIDLKEELEALESDLEDFESDLEDFESELED